MDVNNAHDCAKLLNDEHWTAWAMLKKKSANRNFPGASVKFQEISSISRSYKHP